MFSWKTTTHGLAFKRAIDSIAPLLLEGRVVCKKNAGLDLCGLGDRLSVHYHVDFEGDEIGGTEEQVVFVLDLKETSAWLQVFRSGMTLEVSLDSNGLKLLFNNDSKTFEHKTKLSNLRLPADFVAPLQIKNACDHLLDVSSPALAAVVKHHSKSSTHCSVSYETESKKVIFKSVLRAVDPVKKSETSLAGATVLDEIWAPNYYVRTPSASPSSDSEIYPLDLIKNVMKAYGFHDKKRGRVVVAIDHNANKMTFIFRNELSCWLVFNILGAEEDGAQEEEEEEDEDSDATLVLDDSPKIIKRKKKKQKTKEAADPASVE
jgi:hypothetical protein